MLETVDNVSLVRLFLGKTDCSNVFFAVQKKNPEFALGVFHQTLVT